MDQSLYMTIAKKILFSLLSLFLGYQAGLLIYQLMTKPTADLAFGESFVVAFLLNLFITGVYAFPGFVFPTSVLLGKSYYQVRNPNRLQLVYKVLQVEIFRKMLLFFFWGRGKNRTKYFNGTRSGLAGFAYESRQSEFGHLAALITIQIVLLVIVFRGYFQVFIIATVINLVGNFYPIILQRYHRIRIDRVLNLNGLSAP